MSSEFLNYEFWKCKKIIKLWIRNFLYILRIWVPISICDEVHDDVPAHVMLQTDAEEAAGHMNRALLHELIPLHSTFTNATGIN